MKFITTLLALTLASSLAFADGVPLITPGPTAVQPDARTAARPDFVKVHPIVLNKNAFGANVLTVVVDGVEHRFVGRAAAKPKPYAGPVSKYADSNGSDSWSGVEPVMAGTPVMADGTITIIKNLKTGNLTGSMTLPPARSFSIVGSQLIELNSALAPKIQLMPEPPSPAASGGKS